jgi:membrane protein DedA with SNARE-associated domain
MAFYSLVSAAGQWILTNGYAVMFVGMLIEGPAITSVGSFAAKLGYFNIWTVVILSILGNLIPDAVYYALGFWGRNALLDRWGRHFGVTKERMEKLERHFITHPGKTLFAIKMIPTIATPGLIAAGAARMHLKTYIWWSIAITIPSSFLYAVIGYYFGAAYHEIIQYVDYGGYVLGGFIILMFLIPYLYGKISGRIAEKIEKI